MEQKEREQLLGWGVKGDLVKRRSVFDGERVGSPSVDG